MSALLYGVVAFGRSGCIGVKRFASTTVSNESMIRYSFERAALFIRSTVKPKIISLERGRASMLLPYKSNFDGVNSECVHAGIISSMVDHCSGCCAWTSLTDTKYFINTVGELYLQK